MPASVPEYCSRPNSSRRAIVRFAFVPRHPVQQIEERRKDVGLSFEERQGQGPDRYPVKILHPVATAFLSAQTQPPSCRDGRKHRCRRSKATCACSGRKALVVRWRRTCPPLSERDCRALVTCAE